MELTLQQLFGVNATQDSQTLTINKSDLPLLTPLQNNTAESLLVAILINSLRNFSGYLEDENSQPISDENDNPIEFDNSESFEDLKVFRWDDNLIELNSILVRNTLVIEAYSPYED